MPFFTTKKSHHARYRWYGYQYSFTLYTPEEGTSHSLSLKCPKQDYLASYVYTDDLGVVKRDNLIWNIRLFRNEFVTIPETEAMKNHTVLTFTEKYVNVQGLTGDFVYYNGKYLIEKCSPNSWGIEIVK